MGIQQPKERIMEALFFAPALAVLGAAVLASVMVWLLDL